MKFNMAGKSNEYYVYEIVDNAEEPYMGYAGLLFVKNIDDFYIRKTVEADDNISGHLIIAVTNFVRSNYP